MIEKILYKRNSKIKKILLINILIAYRLLIFSLINLFCLIFYEKSKNFDFLF